MNNFYRCIPNALTIVRILSAPFLWHALIGREQHLAFFLVTFAALSDFGDGYIARRFFTSSRSGSFLDPLADKILITLAFIALWQIQLMPLWVVAVVILRDLAVTVLRIFLARRGKSLRTSFLAKSKTTFQFLALYIFILTFSFESTSVTVFSFWLNVAIAAFTVLSAAPYFLSLFAPSRGRLSFHER